MKTGIRNAVCDTCDKLIERRPSFINRQKLHYCNNKCKDIGSAIRRKGRSINMKIEFQAKNGYKKCSNCLKTKNILEFHASNNRLDRLVSHCKSCVKKAQQQYYIDNRKKVLTHQKIYYYNNKEQYLKRDRKYYQEDWNFYKLKNRLRSAINRVLKSQKIIKKSKTFNLIGCNLEKLKQYLQQTAIDNGYLKFNINNYNGEEYHIDHIMPCCNFNLLNEEEQRKCFHYTNLQILTAQKNLSKHKKIKNYE